MGRRVTTAAVDKYYDDRTVPAATKTGTVVESTCKCCDAPPFLGMTSTRKVAHICGIGGQGIAACNRSIIKPNEEQIRDVASTTKSGKEWLARGAGGPPPMSSCPGGASLVSQLCCFSGLCFRCFDGISSVAIELIYSIQAADCRRPCKLQGS